MADVSLSYGTFSITITTPDITPSEDASPAIQQGAIDAQTRQAEDLINAALDAFAIACEIDLTAEELTEEDLTPEPQGPTDDRPQLRVA